MPLDCVVPVLGENVSSATVVEIYVQVGDRIEKDQSVLSLETDKAEFDMPSEVAGVVSEILVEAGQDVREGQVVARLEGEAGRGEQAPAVAEKPEPKPFAQSASQGSPTPAQASAAPSAPAPPVHVPRPAAATPSSPGASRSPIADRPASKPVSGGPVPASPSIRRIARELGVDIHEVAGSGPGGRIDVEDLKRHVARRDSVATLSPAAPPPDLPDFSKWGPVETEPMSKVRRKTAEQMGLAWSTIPHVTHHDRADITELEALRRSQAARVAGRGGKLTMTAILLKVVGRALKEFPKFNATIDVPHGEIIYKKYVHVGVAVDTEKGLLVPVIRDVDSKSVTSLAIELGEVSEAARGRNIKPDTLQGATFTITNLGGIGGVAFSPLINPPEVAILGVSRAREEPVYQGGELVPRLIMPLAVSYDHRLIDGADAARFLAWICRAIESPGDLGLEDD